MSGIDDNVNPQSLGNGIEVGEKQSSMSARRVVAPIKITREQYASCARQPRLYRRRSIINISLIALSGDIMGMFNQLAYYWRPATPCPLMPSSMPFAAGRRAHNRRVRRNQCHRRASAFAICAALSCNATRCAVASACMACNVIESISASWPAARALCRS